jgi:hypothetical protein
LVDDSKTVIPDSTTSTLGQDTAEIDMQAVIEADDEPPASHESQDYDTRVPAKPPAPDEPAHSEGEQPSEGDDVLEETPSFLQQTPEHDRLWFEQQPPRDFDFDK